MQGYEETKFNVLKDYLRAYRLEHFYNEDAPQEVFFEYKGLFILGFQIVPADKTITFYPLVKGVEMLFGKDMENILNLLENYWQGLNAYLNVDYGQFNDYKVKAWGYMTPYEVDNE